MLLSALTFAVALQAAPDLALKGYSVSARGTQPVGELTVAPRKGKSLLLHVAPERARFIAPPRAAKLNPSRRPAKKDFVVNPQMVNCKSNGPEPVASSEKLRAVPLSKLPRAHGERAVARLVDGCPVAVTIAQGPIER